MSPGSLGWRGRLLVALAGPSPPQLHHSGLAAQDGTYGTQCCSIEAACESRTF
jgi:hypothetical protein